MVPDPASPKPEGGEPKKCPRCDSVNTKFCYFNNYSRSQPRHFCRACCRYWTEGGTLRSVPAGGGARKNKRRKITPIENSSVAGGDGDLRSLPESLKSPAIYTAAAAGSSSSSSSQYSYKGEDFVGGFEGSFLGMMNPLTEISWANQEDMFLPSFWNFWPAVTDFTETAALPESCWDYWDDGRDFAGTGDGKAELRR